MCLGESPFNHHLGQQNGIIQLMLDLGEALADENMLSLGGGNPAHIKEVESAIANWLTEMANDPQRVKNSFGEYSPPIGDNGFRHAYAEFLNKTLDWNVSADNIAVTNGSQSAFFAIFNALAQKERPVFCPSSPDYIGYRNIGVFGDVLSAKESRIQLLDNHEFSYALSLPDDEADYSAVCVSSPCNPTGRCLTHEEITRLSTYCTQKDIPLIIDSAYGAPAPNILFNDAVLPWLNHTLYCFSLSKIGLPGARTGIIVGPPAWIDNLACLTARMNLAPTNIGPNLITPAIERGELNQLCLSAIRPYYANIIEETTSLLRQQRDNLPIRWHRVDGGFFLWLWFEDLPVCDHTLYERLKANNVVVVPGHYFFNGQLQHWPHSRQCIRISLGQPIERIKVGIERIIQTAKAVYNESA